MADLIVTFSKSRNQSAISAGIPNFPVAQGAGARTEAIAIGSSSAASSLAAQEGDHFVEIYAPSDCWIHIAESPEAAVVSSMTQLQTSASHWMRPKIMCLLSRSGVDRWTVSRDRLDQALPAQHLTQLQPLEQT